MSLIFANPLINKSVQDRGSAGWYRTSNTDTNNLVLRVGDYTSSDALTGFIKYNAVGKKFQGYSADGWVDLGGYTGATGYTGASFESQVNFINCIKNETLTPYGPSGNAEIFQTSSITPDGNTSCVFIKSLFSGTGYINNNSINTIDMTQTSNIITLNANPQPYNWDIATADNNKVSYLYGYINDTNESKCFGDKMKFKAAANVIRGQAVCLANMPSSTDIGIQPVIFSASGITDCVTEPCINIIGIALSDATSGNSCNVCVRGITTVMCNTTFPASDSALGFTSVGSPGFVNQNGYIFCPSAETAPGYDYVRAGHFLQAVNPITSGGSHVLFYVDPKISGC